MIPVIKIFKDGRCQVSYGGSFISGFQYCDDQINGHCILSDNECLSFDDRILWSYKGPVIFEYEQ